jgi:hypothetical protein
MILRVAGRDALGDKFEGETTVSPEDGITMGLAALPRLVSDRLRQEWDVPLKEVSIILLDEDGAHIMVLIKYPVATGGDIIGGG